MTRRLLLVLTLALPLLAQLSPVKDPAANSNFRWLQQNTVQRDSRGSIVTKYVTLTSRTIAAGTDSLPVASSCPGCVGIVIDAASSSDCTVGGGAYVSLCRSTGIGWSPIGGGAGGGGGMSALVNDSAPALGGNLSMGAYAIQTVTPLEMARVHGLLSPVQEQLDEKLGLHATADTALSVSDPAATELIIEGPESASPTVATVPRMWFDSAAHLPQYKNPSNILVGTMVVPASSRTANQFCTHVSLLGVCTPAAIANGDLPTVAMSGVLKYISGVPSPIGTSSTNCIHEDGSSGPCSTIPSVTGALKGDGAGNAAAVTGTGSDCVHVDGGSAACPGGSNPTAGSAISVSGSTVNFNPLDPSVMWLIDEFFLNSTNATGQLQWTSGNIGTSGCSSTGNNQFSGSSAHHPGILRSLTASSGPNLGCYLALSNGSASSGFNYLAATNWELRWIVSPSTVTNVAYRAGAINYTTYASNPATTGAWARLDTGAGDTTWKFEVYSTSSLGTADSGVTAVASSWYLFRIRSIVAGTWLFSVSSDGGSTFSAEKSACSSGCDINGALPNSLVPGTQTVTLTTGAATLYHDRFSFWMTGIDRL